MKRSHKDESIPEDIELHDHIQNALAKFDSKKSIVYGVFLIEALDCLIDEVEYFHKSKGERYDLVSSQLRVDLLNRAVRTTNVHRDSVKP